jgi:hypothetical protein
VGVAQFGSALSIGAEIAAASSLSLRCFGRIGGALSLFAQARVADAMSIYDCAFLGVR